MNNNISIKTISELLNYKFHIPSYQRGYRWTKQQVTDLLNDINEFSPKETANPIEKTWYCLQPIVVKQKNENEWEVIDGQQRLTTIYLILYYLKREGGTKLFELEYETREGSANYLKNEIGKIEVDDTNIDYFHISNAYQTIKKWFDEKKAEKGAFEEKFNSHTKVIWYETSKNEDSIDVFTRINSGKIPLTNAELIRALFLNSSNFDENIDPVKLDLKQQEIALEWDRIEYALQDESLWYFINKEENKLATRIEFIFDLMYEVAKEQDEEVAERKRLNIKTKEQVLERQKIQLTIEEKFGNDEYSTFRFFNDKFKDKSEKEITNNWQEIKKYFQTLEEWYSDRELYHKIGYLIAIGTDIKNILNEKKEKPKTAFIEWLDQKIQSEFKNLNLEDIAYGNNFVRKILLLHNIQTILNNENETNRFPFDRYKKEFWDVEHIHAIATEAKVKKENQAVWLENNFIKTERHQNEKLNNQIDQIKSNNATDENEFENIIQYVLGEEDNGLRNLCLLDRGTNRSYKNDSFNEKRRKIIEREMAGTFIPVCTKNVFMKYYSSDVQDIQIWNENDREAYFNTIQEVLKQYLPKTKSTLAENEQ